MIADAAKSRPHTLNLPIKSGSYCKLTTIFRLRINGVFVSIPHEKNWAHVPNVRLKLNCIPSGLTAFDPAELLQPLSQRRQKGLGPEITFSRKHQHAEPSCPTKVTPMSMAVCGNNPSSKAGEYFEAAGLQWLPLVEESPRGSWRDSPTEFKPRARTV